MKPADKGAAVVVMNTTEYTTECTKQLSNTVYYRKLDSHPTATYNTIKRAIQEGIDKRKIDLTIGQALLQPHPTPGRFYILAKIHHEGHPGSPIISGNTCPTEIISQFVDYHMVGWLVG
ncbi:hypothetical protein ElyMa_003258500 [Elysia marginata]|uniref:Uncharacterized protein n=1 Tax=Elysia marginata TaxID=1093978 RepID=A0AAV4J8A1_9GAST|nr:hypothetical protein ElyMa_003258500 [Elysia marginata]